MADDLRIKTNPAWFTSFMLRTNAIQLTVVSTPPDVFYYTTLGWSTQESGDWKDFSQRAVAAFTIFSDPDKTGPGPRKIMKALIKEVRRYDNDPEHGHLLLDLVVAHGTLDDCIAFNVKKGTVLAESTTHRSNVPVKKVPKIGVKSKSEGQQVITCVDPDTPTTKKLPSGAVFAFIYCFVGATKPTNLKQYDYIGIARRGEKVNKIVDPMIVGDPKLYAWYYSCYVFKDGTFSEPSSIIRVPVLLVSA